MEKLTELRNKIDAINDKLQDLLTERAKISLEVAKAKNHTTGKVIYYHPDRESEILHHIIERNTGPIKNEDLVRIFKTIIASSRNLQHQLTIAFLGPLGTFSHEAVIEQFGEGIKLQPESSIKNVLVALQQNKSDYALVPIENSTEGVVNKTLDSLIDTPLTICAEMILPIHHYLLSREKNIKDITQVYSHQQPLAQCSQWLEKNLPNAALLPVKSTSQACMLASKEANTAAIAGKIALNYHDLNIIAEHIEDEKNNATRFYIMGNQTAKPTGRDKTSMLIWLGHQPGTLAALLNYFAQNNINLTLIQSRPYKKQIWEYFFFVEMEGHQQDKNISKLLVQLANAQITYKILGSFPRAIR
jgi:chorismate mutase/prephenate dehydratase